MKDTVAAYIGLGANLGDGTATLRGAVMALGALPDVRLDGVSRLYRTRPVGPVDQADYSNAVVRLEVPLGQDPQRGAMALLVALKGIERAFGRQDRQRWGPRELDLDLLLFGPHRIHIEREQTARSADPSRDGLQWLDVPHASAAERLFVLAPLADLGANVRPPGWSSTVSEAMKVAAATEDPGSVRAVASWDAVAQTWTDQGSAGQHR